MLTLANLGYVMSDVASDGFMVWIAHREPIQKRGKTQTLIYSANKLRQVFINLLILVGFSGLMINCPGYQPDPAIPCTTDPRIMSRTEFAPNHLLDWCYRTCLDATFDWDISIPDFALIIAFINISSIPFYCRLKEERASKEHVSHFLQSFWRQLQRRAAWQVILYSMISHITFGVVNAAKVPANYVWLHLHMAQNQVMVLLEKLLFFIGLNIVRKYALHVSWQNSFYLVPS